MTSLPGHHQKLEYGVMLLWLVLFVSFFFSLFEKKRPRNTITVIPESVDSCSLLWVKGRFYSFIDHFSHIHVFR